MDINDKLNRIQNYIVFVYLTRQVRCGIRNHDINHNTLTLELEYASKASSPTHNKEDIFKLYIISNCILIETIHYTEFNAHIDPYHRNDTSAIIKSENVN